MNRLRYLHEGELIWGRGCSNEFFGDGHDGLWAFHWWLRWPLSFSVMVTTKDDNTRSESQACVWSREGKVFKV